MAQSVKGKTAIVTGAGSDLALRPEAQAIVDQYSASSPRAVFQQTDVTEWSQLEKMFEVAEKEFGEIDIVCPGAGIYGPLAMSRFANSKTPKSIVHVSSIQGQGACSVTPIYCATKHAISGFVRSLAVLDRVGNRVSAVAPGLTKTPMCTDHPDNRKHLDESSDV